MARADTEISTSGVTEYRTTGLAADTVQRTIPARKGYYLQQVIFTTTAYVSTFTVKYTLTGFQDNTFVSESQATGFTQIFPSKGLWIPSGAVVVCGGGTSANNWDIILVTGNMP